MREIKFRIWFGGKFHFIDFTQIISKEDTDLKVRVQNAHLAIWQQYTGLKDKNGKEIYEGDILLYLVNNKKISVIFLNGQFCCQSGYNLYSYVENDVLVLGNIFENPDLLK